MHPHDCNAQRSWSRPTTEDALALRTLRTWTFNFPPELMAELYGNIDSKWIKTIRRIVERKIAKDQINCSDKSKLALDYLEWIVDAKRNVLVAERTSIDQHARHIIAIDEGLLFAASQINSACSSV